MDPTRREVAKQVLELGRVTNTWRADVYALGLFAQARGADAMNDQALFGHADVYAWRFWDELGVYAFYMQDWKGCVEASTRALRAAPAAQATRIANNAQFARARMGGATAPAPK